MDNLLKLDKQPEQELDKKGYLLANKHEKVPGQGKIS